LIFSFDEEKLTAMIVSLNSDFVMLLLLVLSVRHFQCTVITTNSNNHNHHKNVAVDLNKNGVKVENNNSGQKQRRQMGGYGYGNMGSSGTILEICYYSKKITSQRD